LTVFRRLPFGNEKLYEKRINVHGKAIEILNMELHPKGTFVRLSFNIKENDDANEDQTLNDDSDSMDRNSEGHEEDDEVKDQEEDYG
jgi:hypothetical protein